MSKYCCSECGGTNVQVQAWSQRVWYKGLEKDCRLKKKERKWIILKFPWSSTCAQSAEE